MTASPREQFTRIAQGPEASVDLAEAALWIAAESCPELDVNAQLAKLDALAEAVRREIAPDAATPDQVSVINRELFGVHGFHGARDDYYDPRNSFLHEVLARKTGIPISLSVVYIEVARRIGLDANGVNFPGHFLVRVGQEPVIVDAFEGRTASRAECTLRLRAALGPEAELDDEQLAPAGPKQILLRMLGNLKSIHAGKQDFESALACCDRSLLLFPEAPTELRDRGLMYHALECPRPALSDLERYLELLPEGEGNAQIRHLVGQLHADLPPIH